MCVLHSQLCNCAEVALHPRAMSEMSLSCSRGDARKFRVLLAFTLLPVGPKLGLTLDSRVCVSVEQALKQVWKKQRKSASCCHRVDDSES